MIKLNDFNFLIWYFRFLNLDQLIFIFPPNSPTILISVSFREFHEESYHNSLVVSVPVGNNENSFLLILGWKGLTFDFKKIITEKSMKNSVPLSIYFFKTLIVKKLKLLCLNMYYKRKSLKILNVGVFG